MHLGVDYARLSSEHVFVNLDETTTMHKGAIAEAAIAAAAVRLGINVLRPEMVSRYDLAFDLPGRMLRVQCKWGVLQDGVITARLSSSRHSPTQGYVRTKYQDTEVDAIAVYCEDTSSCYLLPIEEFAGRSTVSLRLSPARNHQRAALNWATEYELGAVAQLEERCHGMAEARGSSPLSSTSHESPEPRIEVGAHEFRNQFGYFMEMASGGAEILVRRRGRPYVRMKGA